MGRDETLGMRLHQTCTQLLFMILGERERGVDSSEECRVTWEGAKYKTPHLNRIQSSLPFPQTQK